MSLSNKLIGSCSVYAEVEDALVTYLMHLPLQQSNIPKTKTKGTKQRDRKCMRQ